MKAIHKIDEELADLRLQKKRNVIVVVDWMSWGDEVKRYSKKDHSIEAYWKMFLATLPPNSPLRDKRYTAESFGDNPELADELGTLIANGTKTATCSAVWEWEAEGTPIPEVGLITIVLDGNNKPLCIIETSEVTIQPYNEVDSQFAYELGEGDRSLEYWREGHWRYFSRVLPKIGKEPTLDMPLVCERFRMIYQ